jgi:MoaA/NifB/PqqE/SkfB family radical SAM enzyme
MFSGLEDFLSRYAKLGTQNLAITTNGMMLSEEIAQLIVSSGVNILFLSIDACDPEIYSQMRVGGNLPQIEEGIERVNRNKKNLHSAFPRLVLASTFMHRNIEQLPKMVDFAARHSIDEISVQLMEIETPLVKNESLENCRQLAAQMLAHAQAKAKQKNIRLIVHMAMKNLLGFNNEEPPHPVTSQHLPRQLMDLCRFPWFFIYIDTNGDVRPCCYASLRWGNLERQHFQSIWNGPQALAMRRSFINNILPQCCRSKHCRIELAK